VRRCTSASRPSLNTSVAALPLTPDTAIAETRYHREQFLRATSEPPMELDIRVLVADLQQHLHDIRGWQ
jgi:hypothetical protein